jgi:hypothetical protein
METSGDAGSEYGMVSGFYRNLSLGLVLLALGRAQHPSLSG